MDYRLGLMCGIDLPIPDIPLIIHQPKIKEIALIGEKEFFIGAQCLCINKNSIVAQDKNDLGTTTNFQIFMMVMLQNDKADRKKATSQVLSLLFPNSKSIFTPRSIILQFLDNEQQVLIDENNFDLIQQVARQIFCFDTNKNGQDAYNPANKKAQEIANKLMKGRQRVAELKGVTESSILSQYISALTVGLNSMSLEDCMNLTLYQLYDLIERFSLYTNWDIDMRSRLAGAKSDKKPENWMKNIH